MNKKNLILIPIVIPFIALDVAIFSKGKFQVETFVAYTIAFAVFIGVFYLFNRRGGQKVEKDERTIMLHRTALSYSWMITFFVIAFLSGCSYLELFSLTVAQAFTIVLMLMTFSYFILILVVSRKGQA
jgi:hypothetical protein